jgi:hypothetical protein
MGMPRGTSREQDCHIFALDKMRQGMCGIPITRDKPQHQTSRSCVCVCVCAYRKTEEREELSRTTTHGRNTTRLAGFEIEFHLHVQQAIELIPLLLTRSRREVMVDERPT